MGIPLYDVVVPGFLQTVDAMQQVLRKGLEHCQQSGIDPEDLVGARLYPDMLPLHFQVCSVVQHSVGALECAKAGFFGRPDAPPPLNYPGLQSALAEAGVKLKAYSRDEVNALQGRELIFQPSQRTLRFSVEEFLLSFSLLNFHFHATTAYDILRTRGVPLGKGDYLGRMRAKTQPA